uniref:Uncharacterized protein n=2 Tax=unclassified Caudoviricetes TaxID=2788787 RepID=A0A8S5VAY7_9CAUD|nr:MAG TPA: hypothetical protein [Siphoviridae sp. ctfrT39]DAG03870.1 MAG TPA: hypothetical protein [Siphoviridae sp. ct0vA12]
MTSISSKNNNCILTIAGVDWKSLQPLYKFGCGGNDKYIIKE